MRKRRLSVPNDSRRPVRPATLVNALAAALCLQVTGPVAAQTSGPASLERVVVAANRAEASQRLRAESQRFIVYSDAPADDVRLLLSNLEKLDHLLRLYTRPGQAGEASEPKLTLYYHRSAAELAEVDARAPAHAVGLYNSCAAGVQGFGVHLESVPSLRDEELERAPLDKTLSYVFEAYARHFLYRHTDIRSPTSFIHGFAQYFSAARFSDRQMVVGRTPTALGDYLNILEGGRHSLDYGDVLGQKLAGGHSVGGAVAVRLEFEAKAWLLTHYMLSSAERRQRMNRYLALAGQGVAAPAAFESAFDIKLPELPRVMGHYSRQQVQAMRVDLPSLPAARVRMHALPRAAGEFVLMDAALKSCPDPRAGAALLKKVAALAARFPGDDFARLTLSRAQIDWGDPREAIAHLEALLKLDEANAEARTLLGMAHLRLAERSAGDMRRGYLQNARQHLQQARGAAPPAPPAALALFQAEVAAQEPGTATLESVTAAWRAAREVEALTRSAALAYAYVGNADEAYAALASMTRNSRDDPMARWAKQWQHRLETGVSRGDVLAEMRRPAPADGPFKEWTVERENVAREMTVIVGMERAAADLQRQSTLGRREGDPSGGADALVLANRLLAEAGLLRAKMNRSAGLIPADDR